MMEFVMLVGMQRPKKKKLIGTKGKKNFKNFLINLEKKMGVMTV